LIEDDASIARLLLDNLEFEGFAVQWSRTGRDALHFTREFSPDLVLLDLMLPNNVNGLEICRTLSNVENRVPVIIISARGEQEDRIRGLTVGADDYMVKPFPFAELIARINAVLRRTKGRVDRITFGDISVDFVRMKATSGKRQLVFTDREFQILRYFAEHSGNVVSREELLHLVWGYDEVPLTRTVDNFIFRLRQKIEPDPRSPRYLRKAYGDGYRLTLTEE